MTRMYDAEKYVSIVGRAFVNVFRPAREAASSEAGCGCNGQALMISLLCVLIYALSSQPAVGGATLGVLAFRFPRLQSFQFSISLLRLPCEFHHKVIQCTPFYSYARQSTHREP